LSHILDLEKVVVNNEFTMLAKENENEVLENQGSRAKKNM